MKHSNLLWTLTIINTILLVVFIALSVYGYFSRRQFEAEYFKSVEKFVNESNRDNVEYINNAIHQLSEESR